MHVINATKFLTQYKGTSQFTQYLIIILGNRLQKIDSHGSQFYDRSKNVRL